MRGGWGCGYLYKLSTRQYTHNRCTISLHSSLFTHSISGVYIPSAYRERAQVRSFHLIGHRWEIVYLHSIVHTKGFEESPCQYTPPGALLGSALKSQFPCQTGLGAFCPFLSAAIFVSYFIFVHFCNVYFTVFISCK